MSSRTDDEKLNAILGVALRAVIAAGADDSFIGAFSETYRAQFAKHLNLPAQPAVDLRQVINETVAQAVTQAVQQSVGELLNVLPRQAATRRPKQTQTVYLTVQGVRTSISVSTSQIDELSRLEGSPEKAREVVRRIAVRTDGQVAGAKRSQWVRRELAAYIAVRNAPGESTEIRH